MAASATSDVTRNMDWQTYMRVLRWVRPYWKRLLLGLFFGLIYSAANGAMVWVIRGGIGHVFRPSGDNLSSFLAIVAVSFPGVAVARGVADYLATYYVHWVGHRVVTDMRNALFRHLHDLSVAYFSTSRTGEIISRTMHDTMMIERAVSTVVADVAKQPLTLVFMVVSVFFLDPRLAAVSMVLFPLCIIPVGLFGRRVRRYSRQAQQRIADVVSILNESVAGVRIVKAFGMEAYERRRFEEQTGAFFGRIMRVARATAAVEPVIVLIAAVGVTLLLVYVRVTNMPIDDFFAFIAAYFMMYEPVKKLSRIHVRVQQSSASADRIFEVLDTPCTVTDREGAVDLSGPITSVAFDNVSFSYGDETVLKDISLKVRAGEKLAFVGSSGAGKTTLVNLLPRFYDVTGGRILVNGVDIRDLTLTSLRARIGLVTQETFLFNDTVANNIAYGCVDADRGTVESAARQSHAHDFIMGLPKGYDTVIGERGVRLSGGQRQRISIARAILRNPPVLILDEATSALDTESERMVQAALDELIEGRTVLAIAHRLSTIINCDRIIVLSGGRIVEEGNHGELLAKGGAYKRLYDMQFEVQ